MDILKPNPHESKEPINEIVVEEIISKKTNEPEDERYPGFKVYSISYGRKKLIFYIKEETGESHSHIKNVLEEDQRQENETTYLYTALKKILDQTADKIKISVHYKILTENEKIAEWSKSEGKQIFNWETENEIPDDTHPTLHVFQSIIKPKKQ